MNQYVTNMLQNIFNSKLKEKVFYFIFICINITTGNTLHSFVKKK